MKGGLLPLVLAASTAVLCGCGSTQSKPAGPATIANITVQSKLMGKPMFDVLVTPAGGGKGRPLLVFLHGYGGSPSDTLGLSFFKELRRLGDKAPVVFLPEGDVGWWHDDTNGPWGTYVLKEAIPMALARSGADPHRVAIGGISMGGFGALDLGQIEPNRFCAVGGHSPAIFTRGSEGASLAFDNAADFERHDLLGIARKSSPYKAPVWIDVGNRDELRPAVTNLARELQADHADVSFHVWPGIHNGEYWNAHFADYLRFYVNACD
jgi:S-formylglutathione hydrolase FrmB